MLRATHTDHAPVDIGRFSTTRSAGRLTLIRDLLDRLPDTKIEPEPMEFPPLGHEPLVEEYPVIETATGLSGLGTKSKKVCFSREGATMPCWRRSRFQIASLIIDKETVPAAQPLRVFA